MKWNEITSHKYILNIIRDGYELEFNSAPCELCSRQQIPFNEQERSIITDLLTKLSDKGVIRPASHEPGEIISNILIRQKADGSYRLI